MLLAWQEGSPLVPHYAGRADLGGEPFFLVLLAASFAAYLAGLRLVRRRGASLRAVAVLAVAIQLVPLGAPLLLSTDAWTYWEYGWIANEGGNPYADSPEEYPGNPAWEWAGADWRDTTSVYGPGWTVVSQGIAAAAGDSEDAAAWLFKTLAALAALLATWLAARLSSARAFAAAFVGWNPLLAVHLAGGGHNDAWVAVLVLAAVALAAAGRRALSGAAWVAGIAVKWVPAVFLWLHLLASGARGRPAGWAGLLALAALLAALATWRFGTDWLGAFGPLARNAGEETSYALPRRLEQLGVPDAAAAVLALAALVAEIGRAHV